jgi:hypothetical protein
MKKACQATLLVLLAACSTGTSVTGAWQGERTRTAFSHVLVVGVAANSRIRRSFEVALSDLIRKGGTQATAAVQAGDGATAPTAENVAALVKSTGADAVLVTRLASRKIAAKESETRVGVKTQQPTNLNGGPGLVELFSLEYNEYEEPGELSAKSTVVVESSLYDTRQDGRLVYVVTTTAQYREDRDDVIANVTGAIAGQLRGEGLVR